MTNLAIDGFEPVINYKFPKYNPIGNEEINHVVDVMRSGVLSGFIARGNKEFYGGPKVIQLESQCKKMFGVEHAISVNSWTSGLVCAVGALNIEPGDEIIVSPWTMCASATAILHWNAIPRFVDIERDTFCINPDLIEASINERTKAIMSVDIGGHPANISKINGIAKKYNLKVISDTAQSPLAYDGKALAGTSSDIGGFSLNFHKHINTGEGGILVTNCDKLALRMRLIRNHGEACVEDLGVGNIANMIGHNFRLGEIESAIAIEQLKKLNYLVDEKRKYAKQLSKGLSDLPGIILPKIRKDCTHSFYLYKMQVIPEITNKSRNDIFKALQAEGVPGLMNKFVNLHLLPMYQKRIAYGTMGFPWKSEFCSTDPDYKKGSLPVAEYLQEKSFLGIQMCMYEFNKSRVDDIIRSFRKVWKYFLKLI